MKHRQPEPEASHQKDQHGSFVEQIASRQQLKGQVENQRRRRPEVEVIPASVEGGVVQPVWRIQRRVVGVRQSQQFAGRLGQQRQSAVAEGFGQLAVVTHWSAGDMQRPAIIRRKVKIEPGAHDERQPQECGMQKKAPPWIRKSAIHS
jgi:hypothetical protein